MNNNFFMLGLCSLLAIGCSKQEIPAAHKGRMFDKTGALAFYTGGAGLTGPILGSGDYWTGMYDEIKVLECSTKIFKETMPSLTKDNVQFTLDVYSQYEPNCDNNEIVEKVLNKFSPGWANDPKASGENPEYKYTVYAVQLFDTFVRPALGEALRKSVSNYNANDINANRDKIFNDCRVIFNKELEKNKFKYVLVHELNLSNLDFPDELDKANVALAEQSILKNKAIAERDKVDAEITTAANKKILAAAEGEVYAEKIDKIGAALKRNPEFLQYQLQEQLPGIYEKAGEKGNLIIAAPNPPMITVPHNSGK